MSGYDATRTFVEAFVKPGSQTYPFSLRRVRTCYTVSGTDVAYRATSNQASCLRFVLLHSPEIPCKTSGQARYLAATTGLACETLVLRSPILHGKPDPVHMVHAWHGPR
eukprot:3097534-Rhodomonas_salina.4